MDDQGHPLPPGKVGNSAVKGPTGCRYLADERQSTYVKNGWNMTGDAYMLDEDGFFHYQSRTDDMIVSAGHNIAAPEVEDALLLNPKVAECGVIGVADDARGQIVKAFVVLRPGHYPSPELVRELQDFAKQTVAPYKYPREIEFRATLPRTETGKSSAAFVACGQPACPKIARRVRSTPPCPLSPERPSMKTMLKSRLPQTLLLPAP